MTSHHYYKSEKQKGVKNFKIQGHEYVELRNPIEKGAIRSSA
jgi:hypothetical protein